MPLGDWISFALNGDNGRRGERDQFFGRPIDDKDEFPGGSVDRELEGMMGMMEQMMESIFQGPHSRFGHGGGGGGGSWDDFEPSHHHVHTHQPPARSLRHQYLREVPDSSSASVTSDQPGAPPEIGKSNLSPPDSLLTRGHDVPSGSPFGSRSPFSGWPFFSDHSLRHSWPEEPSHDGSSVNDHPCNDGDRSVHAMQPIIRTTVYSSSSVRRADGSVETTTYNRGADGQMKTTHTRQLPDHRTLTTHEERSANGTVTTREEYSAPSEVQSTSGHVNQFTQDWEQRDAHPLPFSGLFSRWSPRLPGPVDSRPSCPDGKCDDLARPDAPATPLDWVRSWFR